MKKKYLLGGLFVISALVAGQKWLKRHRIGKMPPRFANLPKHFFFQGNRGARGLLPENTIPAFLKSLAIGVPTLKLDIVVSQDKQLVVSHEAWFSHKICTQPNGESVLKRDKTTHLMYQMPYVAIRQFDCGMRKHPDFPQQKRTPAYKPLLKEVIKEVSNYGLAHKVEGVCYNIELKMEPSKGDGIYQPPPEEFVSLLYHLIKEMGIETQVIVQSFDCRILQAMRRLDETIPLALVVDNDNSMEENLQQLGFIPYAYAPNYKLINRRLTEKVHAQGMLIFAWTVNELKAMNRLIKLGVDSIITDYPNLSRAFMREEGVIY